MNRTCILMWPLVEYEVGVKDGGIKMVHEVSFIHAADLHLDSPFKGLAETPAHIFEEIKDSTFQALDNLVEAGIEKKVDFILISGDLFDNEVQSLKAQIRLKRAFERLEKQEIAVYLSYGNHDFIKGNRHKVSYPDNVFIFPDEEVRTFLFEKDGIPLASISGFSYIERAVEVNKTSEFMIRYPEIPFQIAMLHGSIQGNEEHFPYAPFQISELVAKDFNYWALGHIHKREVLKKDPYIVYSGNTQGRHRKETGEKGCYYVKLTKTKTELSFIPLQAITFNALTVDVSECTEVYQLEPTIQRALAKQSKDTPQLLDITLYANHDALRSWQTSGQLDEIIAIINETINNRTSWQHIFRAIVQIEQTLDNPEEYYGEHFLGELSNRFEAGIAEDYIQELYQHKQAKKYLEKPLEQEEQEIINEAKVSLLNKLLRGGK